MENEILTLIQTYAGQGIFFLLFMMLFKKQLDREEILKNENKINSDILKVEYREREDKLSLRLQNNDLVLKEAVEQLRVLEDIKLKVDEIHKRP